MGDAVRRKEVIDGALGQRAAIVPVGRHAVGSSARTPGLTDQASCLEYSKPCWNPQLRRRIAGGGSQDQPDHDVVAAFVRHSGQRNGLRELLMRDAINGGC